MKSSILTLFVCAFATANSANACIGVGCPINVKTQVTVGDQPPSKSTTGATNTLTDAGVNAGATATMSATESSITGSASADAGCPGGGSICQADYSDGGSFTGDVTDTIHFTTSGVAYVLVTPTINFTAGATNCAGDCSLHFSALGVITANALNPPFLKGTAYQPNCCIGQPVQLDGNQLTFDIHVEGMAMSETGLGVPSVSDPSAKIVASVSFTALDAMLNPLPPEVQYFTASGQPVPVTNGVYRHVGPIHYLPLPWRPVLVPEASALHEVVGGVVVHTPSNRFYVTLGNPSAHIAVLDLTTLSEVAEIPNVDANGLAVSSASHHGFSSSNPVVMWDTDSLRVLRTLALAANVNPGPIVLDTQNDLVYLFHQEAPLATIFRASDGSTVAQITLQGIATEAVTDGQGNVYAGMQNSDEYFVDILGFSTAGLPGVTGHWTLSGGSSCAGLAMDGANQILFATCRSLSTGYAPARWSAFQSGRVIPGSVVPVLSQAKAVVFNPDTKEVFSLQIDGTMTIFKEQSPTSFLVENLIEASPAPPTSLALDLGTGRLFGTNVQVLPTGATDSELFVLGN